MTNKLLSKDVSSLVADLEKAYAALHELQKWNRLHHDLDSYLFNIAEWGLGEIDEKPNPESYGVTP